MFTTPVLLLCYNRPTFVESQLTLLLKTIGVTSLYISSDGPKDTKVDRDKVSEVHRVIATFVKKYPKKIILKKENQNNGCRVGVETGINWFFKQVNAGIILEDDCEPNPSFFWFASEMLKRYESDLRVGMISGTNPLLHTKTDASYFFSNQSIIWGWATWKNRWASYHATTTLSSANILANPLKSFLLTKTSKKHLSVMGKVLDKKIDTWDYIWYLTNLIQSRYCIIPTHNMVANRGFAVDATHTKIKTTQSKLKQFEMVSPIIHPMHVITHSSFEQAYLSMIKPWHLAASVLLGYFRQH